MSQVPPTISYASPMTMGNCPLCNTRPLSSKKIYGHPVCKKCYYKFANRRQLGYLVDAILFGIPNAIIIYAVTGLLLHMQMDLTSVKIIVAIVGVCLISLFCLRDGFGGRSPGKRLTDTVVLNEADYQPISFGQSFKRNSLFLIGQIPILGGFVLFVLVIIIWVQVAGGYRLGDRFARTRVIWRKYADLPMFGGHGQNCRGCGYNLIGNVSGVCPECGRPVDSQPPATLSPLPV